MANMNATYYQHTIGDTSPPRASPYLPRRASTQKELRRVEDDEVVQGRIFWLPPREELPSRAVRRAHGKGAVEEGIYNHPVVVISRPADEQHIIHFHIITSFQGKTLHELYSKSNEFHASRRSWYLPISPSPDHPDANSKKTRKRFPTLELAGGATLRWDSYVNLRHVYKIEWAHLRVYSNPDTPATCPYRFERESMIRLLAKSKVLTNYEVDSQFQGRRSPTYPLRIPARTSLERGPEREHERAKLLQQSPKSVSDASRRSSLISEEYSGLSPILQSDFGSAGVSEERCIPVPKKAPPDDDTKGVKFSTVWRIFYCVYKWIVTAGRKAWRRIRSRNAPR